MTESYIKERHIVFVQHGDFAEAVQRFARGEGETYYAQRYSVRAVEDLVSEDCRVSVVCIGGNPYDRLLGDGIRAIGLSRDGATLIQTMELLAPTDLIARTPRVDLLRWALRRGVRTLPVLADSFESGLRGWLRRWRLASVITDPRIEWVGNHNVNACRSLERIGVRGDRIIPWDWPATTRPEECETKTLEPSKTRDLIYVGVQSEAKGLGDAIEGVARLRRVGIDAQLKSVGGGDHLPFARKAVAHGIEDAVNFVGRVEHSRVLEMMRACDAVLVPSRHEYPEGLPMTIYDALSVRTPLIVSDHPMFVGKLVANESCMMFRASDAVDLTTQAARLLSNASLYARISENAPDAFRRIECPAKWSELIHRWLRSSDEDGAWLASYALSTGRYL